MSPGTPRRRRALRPWSAGLGVRFAAGVGVLLLLVGSPFFYFFYTLHRDRALDSLNQATTDMSRLVLQALEQSAFEATPHTLTDVTARLADARFVQRALIVDKTGRVVLSTDPRSVGQRVSRESPTCRVCHAQAPAARGPATIVTDQRGVEVFRTMRPVYNRPACYGCHPPGDRVNGVVMVDYSTDPARGRFRADVWRMLGLALVMFPVTLVAIAALMNGLVVRRVHALVEATDRVRRGDLGPQASLGGDDELTRLAERFNAMTAALASSIQEIDRQRRYLEHVIDSIEEQVLVVDRSLHIVTANRSFLSATGLWKGAVVGQPCARVAHPGGRGACDACPARAVFETGVVQKSHVLVPDPEGHERQYEVFCSPLVDEHGEVVQAIEVRRDVTVRASLEANLRHSERLASLGLLASGISHEINNPLASIAACADGLLRQVQQGCCDTPEGRAAVLEYLDLVKRETMRAKAITERFLILARPPSGRAEVVEMNRVVEDIVSLLKFQADRAGVVVTTELQEPVPPLVGDGAQVRQLVLNLVLNAVQAAARAPRGPGRVAVKTRAADGTIELAVVDNGPGIEPGDTKKIFEPFYSRRPDGQGTGLGLFIAQTIARGLHGTIRVSSRAGEGAAFVVEVPIHGAPGGTPHRR